jgi:acyl carrier protein
MNVEKEFKKMVADIFRVDPKRVKDNTRFIEDLGAKSLTLVTLVAATESKFGIKTTPAETNKNTTVKKAIAYIKKKMKAKKG